MKDLLIIHRKETGTDGPIDESLRVAQGYRYFAQQAEEQNTNVFVVHYQRCTQDAHLNPGHKWRNQQWMSLTGSIEPDYILNHTPIFLAEDLFKALDRKTSVFINEPDFQQFVADKWCTYKRFDSFSPETAQNFHSNLIKNGRCIVKPRKGGGGQGVRIVKQQNCPIEINENEIIQSFIDTSSGVDLKNRTVGGTHDLRVFVFNGNVIGAFLRLAQDKEIANISQGGQVVNIGIEELPGRILDRVQLIDRALQKYNPRFYTADFGIGESGTPWLFEINGIPNFAVQTQTGQEIVSIKRMFGRLLDELRRAL